MKKKLSFLLLIISISSLLNGCQKTGDSCIYDTGGNTYPQYINGTCVCNNATGSCQCVG